MSNCSGDSVFFLVFYSVHIVFKKTTPTCGGENFTGILTVSPGGTLDAWMSTPVAFVDAATDMGWRGGGKIGNFMKQKKSPNQLCC